MVPGEVCGRAEHRYSSQCSRSAGNKARMIQDDAWEIFREKAMEDLIGTVEEFHGKYQETEHFEKV